MNPLTLLSGASLLTKILTAGGMLLALFAVYKGWESKVYRQGAKDTLMKVAAGDAKVVAEATKFRGVLKDCKIRGLKWDQTTGKCAQ